jgi:hypothetical protein
VNGIIEKHMLVAQLAVHLRESKKTIKERKSKEKLADLRKSAGEKNQS